MKIGWVLVSLLAATPISAQGLSKSKNSTANVLEKGQQQTGQDWYEPRRGTAERAYAGGQRQRPGGKEIVLEQTPGFLRGDFSEDTMDGTNIHALHIRKGET